MLRSIAFRVVGLAKATFLGESPKLLRFKEDFKGDGAIKVVGSGSGINKLPDLRWNILFVGSISRDSDFWLLIKILSPEVKGAIYTDRFLRPNALF